MCGIAAIWRHEGASEEDPRRIAAMTRSLAHRGPDDEAYALVDRGRGKTTVTRKLSSDVPADLLLGVRRLAVTDLGPHGAQPATNEDGSILVVLNGAIFDHADLRADLIARGHVFRSASDTEVIAHAYEEWGETCVTRFNGMWAFLLWDGRRRRLFSSRDRFGIKPLVMARTPAVTAFASEPQALLVGGIVTSAADLAVVGQWLAPGIPILGSRTPFIGIEQVPPATNLILDANGLRSFRYWDWPAPAEPAATAPVEAFGTLLQDAVRLRCLADVPASLLLSGGMDSSAIAALAGLDGAGDTLPAFTATFQGHKLDESRHATAAADHAGLPLTLVSGDPVDLDRGLDATVQHLQGPPALGQIVSRDLLLAAVARAGRTVVLEGQGADELLAGYGDRCLGPYVRAALAASDLLGAARALVRPQVLRDVVLPRLRRRRTGPNLAVTALLRRDMRVDRPLPRPVASGRDPLTAHLIDDHERAVLPYLLHFGDAISSAHALESRLPFLDHRLVEMVTRLPVRWKQDGPVGKIVHRRAMEGTMAPAVLARRDKMGFGTPMARWLTPRVLERWRDELLTPDSRTRDLCDPRALTGLFEAAGTTPRAASMLFRAAGVERWWRRWIDAPAASPAYSAASSITSFTGTSHPA
ncbi:MAG: asparagine synthase (glutamine-hydrolyzing) [Geminicoccaceae bacterium]